MTGDVTLRQLRYVNAVAADLNYRRAAEKLFITQPALSSAIRQLEEQLGAKVFDRDTRSVTLTAFGREWLPHVRAALRAVDETLDVASTLINHAEVRIGYLIGTGADLLFTLLEDVERDLPGITIEMTEYDFADPTAGLASGKSDIALIRPPVGAFGLEMAVVEEETWVACLPRAHRLAGKSELRIEELLDEPLIVAPESAGAWRDYWMAADARHGKPALIAGEAATYETETTMVSRGIGVSFTTSSMTRLYDRPGITFVPIVDRPVSYSALAWHPDRVSPSARRLVQRMLDRAQVRQSDSDR
ncbi:LysR family transcriptional regulator [Pseudoclavibacter sp. VKM Ac-2867]|uniref:LysR family transcriptional regulator n=1 Tax=Pseudoclavibacter sp. VKM Ac-2867 TaxID=2783829 RepID=UPI00188D557A|nr:LysR family transcriptional regulator [Pseudoclavibacter sp. VKM Ac-2867]MBF4459271.1 LysR family transcriptional regulator [Pseudoclavibacter sp. VKM Ac-2867]